MVKWKPRKAPGSFPDGWKRHRWRQSQFPNHIQLADKAIMEGAEKFRVYVADDDQNGPDWRRLVAFAGKEPCGSNQQAYWHLSLNAFILHSKTPCMPGYYDLKDACYTLIPDDVMMIECYPPSGADDFVNLNPTVRHLWQIESFS